MDKMEEMNYETDYIQQPSVQILNKNSTVSGEALLIIHSHINAKGKMVLTREEAALMYLELHKFIELTK